MASLLIWVEGDRDRRFFEQVVKPRVADVYEPVRVRVYCGLPRKVMRAMTLAHVRGGGTCWLVADCDDAPCITKRKEKIRERFQFLNGSSIIVVRKKIEGWYLAGAPDEGDMLRKEGLLQCTDHVDKVVFRKIYSGKGCTELEFMLAILDEFDFQSAAARNHSFSYFAAKFCSSEARGCSGGPS